MGKANEKRAAELMRGACIAPDAIVTLNVATALDEAERRALLSLARWASKTATAVERAPVKWHRADEHYAKVETLRVVASECRRRVRGKA